MKSKLWFAGISGDIEDMGDYAAPPVGEECDAGACGTALSATHPPPATASTVCLHQRPGGTTQSCCIWVIRLFASEHVQNETVCVLLQIHITEGETLTLINSTNMTVWRVSLLYKSEATIEA